MSRSKFDTPLVLELRRSRYLIVYLLLIHGIALLALLFPLRMPLIVQTGLFMLVCASLIVSLYRCNYRTHTRIVQDPQGEWRLLCDDGKDIPASLRPDSYIAVGLCILRFRFEGGGKRNYIILPDMLDADTLRQLRVRLRQGRPEATH
jgi:hypothetical protein